MLTNYVIIAWRNFTRHKLFSFINIFGLSLSMALGLVVLTHVLETLRYDSFHPQQDRIYRILSNIKSNDSGEWTLASTPLPLIESLSDDGGALAKTVRIYPAIKGEATSDANVLPIRGAFTGPSFFDVFGFTLTSGNPETALLHPNSIVISSATAGKFFKGQNALGKTLELQALGSFEVTGILAIPEHKSHLDFDVIASESTVAILEKEQKLVSRSSSWYSFDYAYTYVSLRDHVNKEQLEERLRSISSGINQDNQSGTLTFRAQNIEDITPQSDNIYNDIGKGTTWGKMFAEIGVAFIIVLAACFNYTNLSIARALNRTKDVGIRKIIGAKKRQIFAQYIVESLVIAFMALLFSQAILSVLVEVQIFDRSDLLRPDPAALFCIFMFTVGVGVLAGFLPAWILSSIKSIRMLTNFANEKILSGLSLRKALIVFQFTISLVILIFMTTFHEQFSYMAKVDPGYRMDHIASIPMAEKDCNKLTAEILQVAGVENVSASSGNFGRYATGTVSTGTERRTAQPMKMNYFFIDDRVIGLSKLDLIAGKNFTEQPSPTEHEVILNEQATGALGFKQPLHAVGQSIIIKDSVQVTVIGVVRNFYSEGVGISYRPLMLRHQDGQYNTLNVAVNPGNDIAISASLEKIWKKVCPERPFNLVWLQQQHDERHAEMGSITLFSFLAFMAVSIASLGLLGLVIYTVQTRRKEISIRKIVGASIAQLMHLLSRGFIKLLIVAGCIAIPLAYLGSELFLMNFVNRTQVGLLKPVLCFSALLVVGLTMILSQTYRAAMENPADNLKPE